MITILAFVVVLGITITIHEFGHFAMAKLLKIRVLVFSLGFGPKLAGFTHGGTEYRLSPIPLGGYVKMAGEQFDDEREGAPDEFLSHPKWHRFLVAIAGPFMNILLAVFILIFPYTQGIQVPRYPKGPAAVGLVTANSIAQRAGLQPGDRIVSVNGIAVKTWEDMEIALGTAPRDDLNVTVERNDRQTQIHFDPPKAQVDMIDHRVLGFGPDLSKLVVASVDKGTPAQKSGLQAGDEILSIQGHGKVAHNYIQMMSLISESKGFPLEFEVRRSARKAEEVQPVTNDPASIVHLTITPVEDNGRGMGGFYSSYPSDLEKYGIIGAVRQSVLQNYQITTMTFKIIGRIFKGSASVKTLSGPIEIARISGSAARTGSAQFFFGVVGLISLQLGVFNLLPIPIMDGGVMALLVIEGIMRRDLSINLKEKIVQVGFVFLILLMGFVIFNDLSKIIDLNSLFR